MGARAENAPGEAFSRGGRKLEAALSRFAVAAQVRGASAVDVGASTGGFTDALLRHGARSVVAVDSGHDQLDARLRQDARVESLEGANWTTLSLSIAPGPFDFFTVDVSFVAARTMLRGLAFRLRDGAHGVVLVKPQFELPESRLRAGKSDSGSVDDPALRRAALERLSEKAQRLGFTVLEHATRRCRAAAAPSRCSRTCASTGGRRRCRSRESAARRVPAPHAARRPRSRGAGSW